MRTATKAQEQNAQQKAQMVLGDAGSPIEYLKRFK
jgi:hypothetical protein